MPLLVLVVSGSKGGSTMTLASGWGFGKLGQKMHSGTFELRNRSSVG
jgi:hypothetical protein